MAAGSDSNSENWNEHEEMFAAVVILTEEILEGTIPDWHVEIEFEINFQRNNCK